jgi:hypothetical protein
MKLSLLFVVGLEYLWHNFLLLCGEGIATSVRSLAPSIGALHLLLPQLLQWRLQGIVLLAWLLPDGHVVLLLQQEQHTATRF